MKKLTKTHGIIFLAAFVIGALGSIQLSFLSEQIFAGMYRNKTEENPIRSIKILLDQNMALQKNITDMTQEASDLKDVSTRTATLQKKIETQELLTGEVPVIGQGVRYSTDADLSTKWVLDILNTLWVEGAEAIAINGIRITNASVGIEKNTKNFLLNGQVLTPPLEFTVIGNTALLEKTFSRKDAITDAIKKEFPKSTGNLHIAEVSIPKSF